MLYFSRERLLNPAAPTCRKCPRTRYIAHDDSPATEFGTVALLHAGVVEIHQPLAFAVVGGSDAFDGNRQDRSILSLGAGSRRL